MVGNGTIAVCYSLPCIGLISYFYFLTEDKKKKWTILHSLPNLENNMTFLCRPLIYASV